MLTDLQNAADGIRMGRLRGRTAFLSWVLYSNTRYSAWAERMFTRVCYDLRLEYIKLQEGCALNRWPR